MIKKKIYNPQRAAKNSRTNIQANDGNLDDENPQGKAGGISLLQGSDTLPATLVSRTVPGKSYAGAGRSFIGADPKGVIKPAPTGNNPVLPKRKK
jgi:hypothetical protein